jgi:hypothetical protein
MCVSYAYLSGSFMRDSAGQHVVRESGEDCGRSWPCPNLQDNEEGKLAFE